MKKRSTQAAGYDSHRTRHSRLTLFLDEMVWAMLFIGTLGIIYLLYKGPPDYKLRSVDLRHPRHIEKRHPEN